MLARPLILRLPGLRLGLGLRGGSMHFPRRSAGLLLLRLFNAPVILLFPMAIPFPAFPVAVDIGVRNSTVVPLPPLPLMLPIVIPPSRRNGAIKRRHLMVTGPTGTIVLGAIPLPLPRTPPPTAGKKDLLINIGRHVHIGSRQDDKFRRGGKMQAWRQGNVDVDKHFGRTGEGGGQEQSQNQGC